MFEDDDEVGASFSSLVPVLVLEPIVIITTTPAKTIVSIPNRNENNEDDGKDGPDDNDDDGPNPDLTVPPADVVDGEMACKRIR